MAQYVTNLDFFMELQKCTNVAKFDYLFNLLSTRLPLEVSEEDVKIIKKFTKIFIKNFKKRWLKAHRNAKTFRNQNLPWLDSHIRWPSCASVDLRSIFSRETIDTQEELSLSTYSMEAGPSNCDVSVSMEDGPPCCDISTNTPLQRKAFADLSNKQKKRRSGSLLDHDEAELTFALISKLREKGNTQLADIIRCLSMESDKTQKTHDFLFQHKPDESLPEDEILALFSAINISKWQYQTLRTTLNEKGISKLPSYYKILKAKKSCYPQNPEDINVTETGAKIKLQAILDLTVEKILKITGVDFDFRTLRLICKWGCDGSSSHSNYKQKHSAGEMFSDSSVFMASLVPLRLMCGDVTVWENPRPSSTSYCRPFMFEFMKETEEVINSQINSIDAEISNLIPTKIGDLVIFHELHMTMIDGKVATVRSETRSYANCNICHATPKEMNKWEVISNKPPAVEMYKYGLSSLHMWIRCFECILHISYNLDFKQWAARGEHKLLKEQKKKLTQTEMFQRTGLLVDIVKQGFGTTNDGNTARRFFRCYEKSAEITKVDENLIKRFAVILQAISSGKNINIENFRGYCKETAQLYISLYPWYYMPSSVHKLLLHGADICQHFSFIPVGMLSEEASEARNKDFRHIREKHSRKISRKKTNEDIIHNFLVSSDPYISNLKPKFKKTHMLFFPEVDHLLEDEPEEQEAEEEEVFIDLEMNFAADPLNF